MEKKINIAEILKDCPKGMELDCTMYEDVYFDYVDELNMIHCYIQHETYRTSLTFNQHGTPNSNTKSKCVIFPKGKTTWEGFQRPFVDGDVLISGLEDCCNPFIFKQTNGFGNAQCYCAINVFEELILNSDNWTPIKGCRLATEEEKQKLFDAIKANGYRWNAKTKTLEKLVEPKFKVGDKVVKKGCISVPILITRVGDTYYWSNTENSTEVLPIADQDNWELVPNKFDVTTLKPFDKVLVRQDDDEKWGINFFGFYNYVERYYYTTGNWIYKQCIPYEENEHLLGTTDDCDEYFKTWE